MKNRKLIEVERAKIGQMLEEVDGIALERQSKLDELWELERKTYTLTMELRRSHKRIDELSRNHPA